MSAAGTISRGGCHCGRVAFEVEGRPERVDECHCSICTKKGYLHWIVPRESFQLLTPAENVSTYTFNTGVAKHHFCPNCGVAAFYIPRSDPDKIDVNARCLDGVELAGLKIERFDPVCFVTALQEEQSSIGIEASDYAPHGDAGIRTGTPYRREGDGEDVSPETGRQQPSEDKKADTAA